MIYMSGPGDNAQRITRYLLGYDDDNYAKMLCLINQGDNFTPYQPIVLPGFPDEDIQKHCAKILKGLTSSHRYIIQQLQHNKINPNHLLTFFTLLKEAVYEGKYNNLAIGFSAAQLMERMTHLHHHQLHSFKHLVDKAFITLKKMTEAQSHQLRLELHGTYKNIQNELKHTFPKEFKRYIGRFHHLFHENGWHSIRLHKKMGWHFSHQLIAHDLTRIIGFVKQISHGLFALDITGTLIDAGLVISHNKHWFEKLSQMTVDIEAYFAAGIAIDGIFALLCTGPVGWVGLICAGALTLLEHQELMQHVFNPYLNYIDRNYPT
jgi:hypothetical protein